MTKEKIASREKCRRVENRFKGADYMSQASRSNWAPADSCHEYLSSAAKEHLNELKNAFTSELNQCLF